MYTRCKACDSKFKPKIDKLTKEEEDMCPSCLVIVSLALRDEDVHAEETPEVLLDIIDLSLEGDGCADTY